MLKPLISLAYMANLLPCNRTYSCEIIGMLHMVGQSEQLELSLCKCMFEQI